MMYSKEPVTGSTSTDSHSKEVTPPQPIPITGYKLNIYDFLKRVKNNFDTYVNLNRTPTHGSYLVTIYINHEGMPNVLQLKYVVVKAFAKSFCYKMGNISNLEHRM